MHTPLFAAEVLHEGYDAFAFILFPAVGHWDQSTLLQSDLKSFVSLVGLLTIKLIEFYF